jgi:hypothetical protein
MIASAAKDPNLVAVFMIELHLANALVHPAKIMARLAL